MGRIRTGFVKRQAEKLMKTYGNQFSSKFESNKKKVSELAEVPTKKLRNLIAGYITKKLKAEAA
ncbi:MAG: 30S ribosomal protein S17e [Candidatus Nanoarchaeia archaeon]